MNAKQEFLKFKHEVKCAEISVNIPNKDYTKYFTRECLLPINYTPEEYETFIESLDFEYDAGYGGQRLFGTIWFKNGNWADRGEYDGSEWWEYLELPVIPDYLIK